MSLQTLAHHLQSAGRGNDSVLVHMTPREVSGLQSLAMAHGGSLTINPQTGLPEAGFLSSILPMVAGFALGPAGAGITFGGLSSAASTGLLIGGATTLMTGSLRKGLMAGLGAYGGAGLGGSLASAAPVNPAMAALQTPALNVANAQMPVAAGSITPAAGGGVDALKAGLYGTNPAGQPLGVFSQAPAPVQAVGFGPQNLPSAIQGGQFPVQTTVPIVRPTEATVAGDGLKPAPSVFSNVGAGAKEIFSDPEKFKKFLSENRLNLLSSLAPAFDVEPPKRPEERRYKLNEYDWNREFNPSPLPPGSTAERLYFADGGMTVENMSQQNAMLDNPRYPMAMQTNPTYAMPAERPISQNVIYPATDAGVTAYSGSPSYADGGITKQQLESGIARLKKQWKPSDVAEVSGEGITALTKNWDSEISKQKLDVARLMNSAIARQALQSKDPEILKAWNDFVKKEEADISAAEQAKTKAVGEYGGLTKRTSEGIGSRSVTRTTREQNTGTADSEPRTITHDDVRMAFKKQGIQRAPTIQEILTYTSGKDKATSLQDLDRRVQSFVTGKELEEIPTTSTTSPSKMVLDSTGAWVKAKPEVKYQKIGYGKINPLTGWDTTAKYLEPEDVKRVYEEVVGRAPTQSEIDRYISGKKMSLQGLADSVNKLPELREQRTFSDNDLQEQAKYYWGRELKPGELSSFRNKKFTNFAQLRNAFGSENFYVDNLNKINEAEFTKQQTPAAQPADITAISSKFYDTLQRRPNDAEVRAILDKKLSAIDLEKELKNSNEYVHRFLLYTPNSDNYIGNLNPYVGSATPGGTTGNVTTGGTGNVITGGTGNVITGGTTGNVVTLPGGGGSGLVPPVTYTPLSKEQLEEFKRQYRDYTPTSGQSIYTPLGATGALPEFEIEGAMQTFSPEETLGLTNMYKQFAQKMPDIQTGLSFTPAQAQLAASPFANTSPGIVSLQSAAAPSTKMPAEESASAPIIPGSKTGVASLTPEEQMLLSAYQSLPQNRAGLATGGIAGGQYHLGDYSDGGRLLKGPGDGVSDSIPASIGGRQPARLADGEFVIPARIVSELGNGSTDAGARQLYAMMDRIQKRRRKTVGKGKVAVDSNSRKLLPV